VRKKGFQLIDGKWTCLSCGEEASIKEVKWKGKTYVAAKCRCGNEDIVYVKA
jgi:transcription elongation factor Elf1